ncbi:MULTISPECIES: winged helix-turn-helix transcriptional regulator [Paenibacillus]|uniref:winged helix-turn-helix transcriptional regulator n=1 Tax=Paenibacillus TaxID=44249 RepID=UPI0022B8D759|nr:helix-turn-helix domain-containing protein [Paenibacillus caseinilyticus]MCZ8521557.1 helix-turn-helix domain-containing protein [Paenibacillus caseinilyticus]
MRVDGKPETDISAAACSYSLALDVIATKWKPLIIYALENGSQRYGEMKRRIEGVSQKMLTETLRGMERDGLIVRTVHPSVPPAVDYELTPLGRTLIEPLQALHLWAKAHHQEVVEARERFEGAVLGGTSRNG